MEAEKAVLIEAWKICSEGKHKNADQYQKAYEYIEHFKHTSIYLLDIGFEFAFMAESFELGHFGLQLIGDLIKFKWKDIDGNTKNDVKNKLTYLITNLSRKNINSNLVEYPVYFKNTLCLTFLELIKRVWPQNWPTLLNELAEVSKKSVDQKILVFIIYKFIVEEFITNENPNLPAQRRKDITQYLNAHMEYVYGFFLESLEDSFNCIKIETNPSLLKNHISILSSCLSCINNYVDWINISFVFSRNYSLINIIFALFHHKDLCVDAAKCFITILNRKGSVVERKPLSNLFNDELLAQIYVCIKNSLTDSSFKELLKYLVQILISIGTQLNSLWTEPDYKPPFDLNSFLNAIFELIISDNRLFSYEAIQLWISLMGNQHLQTNPTIVQATINLSNIMTNSKLLFKINPDNYLDEFNSEEDFRRFSQKYRNDLAKLIKLSTRLYLEHYLTAAFEWAAKIIYETKPNDQSGYDPNSFLYMCWDAVLFLWTSIMQAIGKTVKEKSFKNESEMNFIKEKLISLISLCVKFNCANANYCSFNFSLQSTIIVSCELENTEVILETILGKLFGDFILFQNKYIELDAEGKTDAQILKSIQNLRKQIAANILNICRSYASKIMKDFEEIYTKCMTLINNTHSTSIERVIFIQSLIFCNNENNSYAAQSAFIEQFLRPIYEFFLSQEFQASVQNVEMFIKFVGLNESLPDPNTLQNRRQIFFYLNVLFAILKSVKANDETLNQSHFAFASFMKIFEPLLQFIKCLNAIHSPDAKSKLNPEFLEMTEAAKTLAIGINQPSQSSSNQIFSSTTFNLSNDSSYYTDKILMFVFNSYEDLQQLIALYFIKFRYELLLAPNTESNSDFFRKCGDALFSNFFDLPDFRTRLLVKYTLRSLLSFNFEKKNIEQNHVIVSLNETFLEYFLPSILARIDIRIKQLKNIKENMPKVEEFNSKKHPKTEFEQIEKQIAEENQFILLCRDVVDLIRLFFNFNNTAFNSTTKQINQTNDELTIEDNFDHENIDQDLTEKTENSNIIKLSELAVYLLKKNKTVYQSIILLLFEGLNLPDSSCCLKMSQIAFTLFKVATVTNLPNGDLTQKVIFVLNDAISEQLFKCCLNAIQVHGEHHEISNLLVNLSYLLYEKFPVSSQIAFNMILHKIPNLNNTLYNELLIANDKIALSKAPKPNDKQRKEIYKKIIQPIIGKNVSQLYKNDIEIGILQPLNIKINNRSQQNNQNTEINICSLFDPNQS